MPGRVIAIGDIHGCSLALRTLIEVISPTKEDIIVTLGDYVDRGPDTRGVVDQLILLSSQCQLKALYGNHEEMMLEVIRDGEPPFRWLQFGGVDTLESYGFCGDVSVIPKQHRDFFESLFNFYETDSDFFVHANYDPKLPLEQMSEHSLRWQKLTEYVPPPHINGKRAIIGHTHDRGGEIFNVGHLICLDTFCYGGGWLTAMEMGTDRLWQSNSEGKLRESVLKAKR